MCRRAQKRDFFPWQRYGCVEHPTSCREAVLLCGALPPPARGAGNAVRAGAVRRPFHIRGHLQGLRDFSSLTLIFLVFPLPLSLLRRGADTRSGVHQRLTRLFLP